MNKRLEFNRKAEEIINFLDVYEVLRREQIEKFFPCSKKIVNYLIKGERLYESSDGIYIGAEGKFLPDKCLIAALSVLADVFKKVHSHAKATAPVQISFLTYSGEYYEIIYVGYGMEVMMVAFFETQIVANQRLSTHADTGKRMVIVEDKSQMTRLQMPGIARFALIQPDGSLSYFKGS